MKVSPSLLAADFSNLKKEIESVKSADSIHYDVMDGHFVKNISFGADILKNLADLTTLPFHVHLMISDPLYYLKDYLEYGQIITFHLETTTDDIANQIIETVHKSNKQVGISIKPGTNVETIYPYLDKIDVVLVMSVEPGWGGQSFMMESLEKVEKLVNERKRRKLKFMIEIDGGINDKTGALATKSGVDVLIAGSYIFKSEDKEKRIEILRQLM